MYLNSLTLRNYRNFAVQQLEFHPRFNLIIGQNAQGKTNLLEAIYYLGFLSSFRSTTRKDLIHFENQLSAHTSHDPHPGAMIEGDLRISDCDHNLKVYLEPTRRRVMLNGKKVANIYEDYYGLMPILLFEPQDVYLLRQSPSLRRKFINKALFLNDPLSLRVIREYEDIVTQKNRLLKDKSRRPHPSELDIWNERLMACGVDIMLRRINLIRMLNEKLPEEYCSFSRGEDLVTLLYKPSFSLSEMEGSDHPQEALKDLFKKQLAKRFDEEMIRREACVGPHRDDWHMMNHDQSIGQFGSQGENRTGIIALKSALVQILKETRSQTPLFILDDVASELDETRKKALFHYLRETQGQVFLSTTSAEVISPEIHRLGRSFLVEEGRVRVIGDEGFVS